MDTSPQAPTLYAPIGDSGLKAYGGFLTEEFLPELQGQKGRAIYRRMANNDATIGGMLYGLTALTCNVEWTWQAKDDSEQAEAAKTWMEECFNEMDTPLGDVINEACSMFTFGFAPCEVTYRPKKDGKIGVAEIALRSQTSLINWEMDTRTGALLGMNQLATWKGSVFIPRKKLALFRTESVKQSPEGRSILRQAYRSWYFKSKLEEIEAVGAERNNAGLPIIRIPSRYLAPDASPEEKRFVEDMRQVGVRIRRDQQECVLVASDVDEKSGRPLIDMSLLTPGGKTVDIGGMIDRYDRAMARSVLMQWIHLGATSAGSFALSSNQTDLFATALGSYVKRMADTINRDVVDVLWKANGFDDAVKPKLTHGDLEKPDPQQLAQFIGAMVGAGAQMFPDRDLENQLRKQMGLPLAPEEGLGPQGVPGMMNEDGEGDPFSGRG